jgi:hypothetical protein
MYTKYKTIRLSAETYDKLPQEIKDKIFEADVNLAHHILDNFDRLPARIKDTVGNLLFRLAATEYLERYLDAPQELASAILDNFDKLPENLGYDVLYTLIDNQYAYEQVAYVFEKDFDKLHEVMRNKVIERLSTKPPVSGLARTIVNNFNVLPSNLKDVVYTIAADDYGSEVLCDAMIYGFKKLPQDVRNQLLTALSDKEDCTEQLAKTIIENFDEIPVAIRNNLLLKLSNRIYAFQETLVEQNGEKLSIGERNRALHREHLITTTSEILSEIIMCNFYKVQEDV